MSEPEQSRPKGTQDFLPPESERLRHVEEVFGHLAARFGFRAVITPTFEHASVFVKSSGATSDVVTKEMYEFRDRSERHLVLRPEGTPGVVRAVLEGRSHIPCRLYYTGSYFRYSRPQKGRYREFHQLGVEVLGEPSPQVDAEVIYLGSEFFATLGIADCTVKLNSIGCRECRPGYREKLVAFLSGTKDALCPDCWQRRKTNPMRVFDCKVESCRRAVADAPAPGEHLCPDCTSHFAAVREGLERRRLVFELDTRLVRGLDYYNRTTFEYVSARLGAQDSLGGGGRYDYLVAEFGGPDTPAVGFALGTERTLLAMPEPAGPARRHLAFVVFMTPAEFDAARDLVDRLRADRVAAQMDYDAKKPSKQFRAADASGACCCVIIGPDELARGVYSLKDLATGEQTEVPADLVIPEVRALFRD
jgi:histidyl-tRNA synthetase